MPAPLSAFHQDDDAQLESLEHTLCVPDLSHEDALHLGLAAITLARQAGTPIEVAVIRDHHVLFAHAMAGTSPENTRWIRRKINTMRLMGCSSLLAMRRLELAGTTLQDRFGVDAEDHSPAGGGMVLRRPDGVVLGHLAVSGLPHRADHDLAVAALRLHLAHPAPAA